MFRIVAVPESGAYAVVANLMLTASTLLLRKHTR